MRGRSRLRFCWPCWCASASSAKWPGSTRTFAEAKTTTHTPRHSRRQTMATNAVVTQTSPETQESIAKKLVGTVPGILLLAVVGWAGKFIEQSITSYRISHHVTLPNIEYVLWAIVIGLIIANTIGVPRIFRAGVATYDFWLKAGIVLLGARFLLGDIRHLGGISLLLVALELAIALSLMTLLGRIFHLKP